ncbi:MAG: NUDIX hydrolase [Alphaproteobacteria bacterium]|jgi:8-oxo-dGTP diphosphatase|nr:NUDIX hydrolase [Alphaproteobacteria bacterium]
MNTVFFKPPPGFQPKVSVAGCYCEFEDKILLLKRNSHKHQGDTWGIPGGKLDEGETPREAAVREVFEEVGIRILEDEMEEISELYIHGPLNDYIFYRFRARFKTLPVIDLSLEEHVEASWLTVEEALIYPLIYGGVEALQSYQEFVKKG